MDHRHLTKMSTQTNEPQTYNHRFYGYLEILEIYGKIAFRHRNVYKVNDKSFPGVTLLCLAQSYDEAAKMRSRKVTLTPNGMAANLTHWASYLIVMMNTSHSLTQ